MLNKLHDPTQTIATVRGKMLRDANFAEEGGIIFDYFLWRGVAVEIAKEGRYSFDDCRVRFGFKMTTALLVFGDDPELRHTALDLELVDAQVIR